MGSSIRCSFEHRTFTIIDLKGASSAAGTNARSLIVSNQGGSQLAIPKTGQEAVVIGQIGRSQDGVTNFTATQVLSTGMKCSRSWLRAQSYGNPRKAFKEALKTYRELERKDPETYLAYVAKTLNNLGVFDHTQNRLEEARKALEEALKTYRELAQKYQEAYLPDVALALNNLGILDSDQHRTEEARRAFEEALQIYEAFAKQDPEQFSPEFKRVKKLLEELPR
jgi:tetratricopeptide (TPR) repeat protein